MSYCSPFKSLTLPRICDRRLCRIRDEHYEHGMQALTHQINDLRLHSLAGQGNRAPSSSAYCQSHVLTHTPQVNSISNLKENDVPDFRNKDDMQTAFQHPSLSTRFNKSIQTSLLRSSLTFRRAIRRNDKVFETFFGTFRMSSVTRLLIPRCSESLDCSGEAELFEDENIFRLIPPSWLTQFGFTYGVSGRISQSPLSGPTLTLDVVRSVPDDAAIFDLCREGKLDCVQALLNRGKASVRDVDSQGRTPLYVSSDFSFNPWATLHCLF